MKTIGLTGSIGSGKTLVSAILEQIGYPVFNSDLKAKLQLEKPEIIEILVEKFGIRIIKDNNIDKTELAQIVFTNQKKLSELNSIIHPFVIAEFENWKMHQNKSIVFMESALIFEHKLEYLFNQIICVWSPENICIERCQDRDKRSIEDIKNRISNQLSPEIKCSKSDFVIRNDNSFAVLPQVFKVLNEIENN